MKKQTLSLLFGVLIGILDIIPMLIQNLPWYETASAFSLWLIASIFNYYLEIKKKGFVKGVIISFSLFVPVLFLIMPQGIKIVLIVSLTNLVLGAILGYSVERVKKQS